MALAFDFMNIAKVSSVQEITFKAFANTDNPREAFPPTPEKMCPTCFVLSQSFAKQPLHQGFAKAPLKGGGGGWKIGAG